MQAGSVSQGIFFDGPLTIKKASRGSNREKKLEDITLKYFDGFSQPGSTADIRCQFYRHLLKMNKKKLLKLQESWYKDFVTDVVKYVKISEPVASANEEATVPIAFLATGLPQDENKKLLDQIFMEVQNLTPHIANLSSKTCASVKNAFQIMCKQLMNQTSDDSECNDNEDLNATSQNLKNTTSRLKSISSNDLQNWYKDSPQKPVVIFIQDIDLFPLTIAQNLLMAFSCLKLPVIFVVGVMNCCENFDLFVPHRCPTTFLYKTFHSINPNDRLTNFMNEIILNPNSPLQLSGPVVRYMSNIFLQHSLSCTKLEQILQMCMLEHFRTPESILCTDNTCLRKEFSKSEDLCIPDIVKQSFGDEEPLVKCSIKMKIEKEEKNGLHAVTSLGKYSPRKGAQKAVDLNVDDLQFNIMAFHTKKLEWYAYLKFLYAITRKMTGSSFGDKLPEKLVDLYTLCWNGDIFKDSADQKSPLDTIVDLFKIMSRPQLEIQLTRGVEELKTFHANYDCTMTNSLELLTELEKFVSKLQTVEEEDRKLQEEREKKELPQRGRSVRIKAKSQVEFMEKMREKINEKAQKLSLFSALRLSIAQWITKQTKKFLSPLHQLPHSKAFIFDKIKFIQDLFTPNPQKRIHEALVEPSTFLVVNEMTNGYADEEIPDISTLYKIILEQEMQNINLNVIFESFKSFIEVSPSPSKRRSVASKPKKQSNSAQEQMYLLRFRQAVAELQHMGFLKRSKFKVDEVSRQTFGF